MSWKALTVKVFEGGASRLISAVNYVKTGTVLAGRLKGKRRQQAIDILDEFLATLRIDVAPLDEMVARAALKARLDYGKGFGRRGGLNLATASPTRWQSSIPPRCFMSATTSR